MPSTTEAPKPETEALVIAAVSPEVSDPQPEITPEPEVIPEAVAPQIAVLKNKHIIFPKWLATTAGSTILLLVAGVVTLGGALAFQSYRASERDARRDQIQEMLITNMIRMNEQQVIRNIVEEKLPQLSSEVRSRIAFEIYEGCRRNGIPYHMVLGLIEQESSWDPKIRSSAGAGGLMQLMVETAQLIAKSHGEQFSLEKMMDPVTNVIWGIETLMNKHEAAIVLGRSSRGDFSMALNNYVGGDPKYILQVMQKAVAYKKRLDAPMAEATMILNPPKTASK